MDTIRKIEQMDAKMMLVPGRALGAAQLNDLNNSKSNNSEHLSKYYLVNSLNNVSLVDR